MGDQTVVRAHTRTHTQRHEKVCARAHKHVHKILRLASTRSCVNRVHTSMHAHTRWPHQDTQTITVCGGFIVNKSRQEDDHDGVFAGFSGLVGDFRTCDVRRVGVVSRFLLDGLADCKQVGSYRCVAIKAPLANLVNFEDNMLLHGS